MILGRRGAKWTREDQAKWTREESKIKGEREREGGNFRKKLESET